MAGVKVIGSWYSPYAKRVEMALKLKGVDYEYVEEDLQNKSPLLLQHNPIHKRVPVLVHNGKAIAESLIILEYIDEVWEGPPILPKNPFQRATARFWANFIDQKCVPTLLNACLSKGEEREKSEKEGTEALEILENEIRAKKFFGGDHVGFVDIAAIFIAHWLPIISELMGVQILTEEKFPNLCRWANDYCSDTFVKQFLPPKQAFVDKFKPK
ncbi:glutathione S-transferase TAU 8 [Perilla frutescens var. hirtella]|nr:glutathione S-transferase TAU 8 [Perilla frutescens var. hirtella]